MAGEIVSLDVGGNKYLVDSATDTLILLEFATPDTTGVSGEQAGTDYQVTAGKTFKIIAFYYAPGSSSRTLTLFQADAADSGTGEVVKIVMTLPPTTVTDWFPAPNLPTVAAEKFVNLKTSNATGTGKFMYVIGVEV